MSNSRCKTLSCAAQSLPQRAAATLLGCCAALAGFVAARGAELPAEPAGFFAAQCSECHDADSKEAGLDLTALGFEPADAENRRRWIKIYDRLTAGEMPPKEKPRPNSDELVAVTHWLHDRLVAAEHAQQQGEIRTGLRRLTRVEYENTMRDLFALDGIPLQADLPADGSAHGFDKNSDALDISHVHVARYIEMADRILDAAIATRPAPPPMVRQRVSMTNLNSSVAGLLMNGDAVLLKDKQPDPDYPPPDERRHLDASHHYRMGLFTDGASVGMFRPEDENYHPSFVDFTAIYPGRYRLRASLWSFQWDHGKVLPPRGTEAVRLSVIQLQNHGMGGRHPNFMLTYFDAPPLNAQEHELVTWLNPMDTIGFNAASLAPGVNFSVPKRVMGVTAPGIACDWLDCEGPIHDVWPPMSHTRLFGDLPLVEFNPKQNPDVRPPLRKPVIQDSIPAHNKPDPVAGLWTVQSQQPLVDVRQLLRQFLPQAFRRPIDDDVCEQYVAMAAGRLAAGDCFETAMRSAYRAALCSPGFLYHAEPAVRSMIIRSPTGCLIFCGTRSPTNGCVGWRNPEHCTSQRSCAAKWNVCCRTASRNASSRISCGSGSSWGKSAPPIPTKSCIRNSAPTCRIRWWPRPALFFASSWTRT